MQLTLVELFAPPENGRRETGTMANDAVCSFFYTIILSRNVCVAIAPPTIHVIPKYDSTSCFYFLLA